jgi:hypothetical protein
MKRRYAIIAGAIALLFCVVVLGVFRPWSTPMASQQSLDALFAEADKAIGEYYSIHKAYPDSLKELKLTSNLAPYLKYIRTGNSSCKMIYFSLGDLRVSSSATYF